MLRPLVVGAPFGNYVGEGWATRTLGSFTLEARGGRLYRLWKILKTVRYYPGIKAWKNKLGLPNPGIDWLVEKVREKKISVADKIVSVFAFSIDEATTLLQKADALDPLAIELNVSCPNVEHKSSQQDLAEILTRAVGNIKAPLILKLPPVGYRDIVDVAVKGGVKAFHCCNTLPCPGGGISGKPLKALSLEAIRYIRKVHEGEEITIIGGGGVTEFEDIIEYMEAGADSVSIASCLFNPYRLWRMRALSKSLGILRQGKHI